jgi:hypothetical protein
MAIKKINLTTKTLQSTLLYNRLAKNWSVTVKRITKIGDITLTGRNFEWKIGLPSEQHARDWAIKFMADFEEAQHNHT